LDWLGRVVVRESRRGQRFIYKLTIRDGQFSTPIYLLFLTDALTFLLLLPILVLTLSSPPLRRSHYPLMALPLATTLLTYLVALLSSALVRRAKETEGKRVVRMVTAARHAEDGGGAASSGSAATTTHDRDRERRQEEDVARALVGLEGGRYWGRRVWGWVKAVLGFLAGLVGATVVVVSLCLFADGGRTRESCVWMSAESLCN
jgi:hypothetical protein